jgi:hypothetical protein
MSAWTSRSQRSLVRQIGLEKALARCERSVDEYQAEVAHLEGVCEGKIRRTVEGNPSGWLNRAELFQELESAKLQLAAFQDQAGRLRGEIAALVNPTPEEVKRRAEGQARLARLATDRLEKDREIHGAIRKLRSLLEERGKLTTDIGRAADAIDMTVARDGLDQGRFEVLSGSLPSDLGEESEVWLRAFFGGRQHGTMSYTVIRGPLTFAESLASAEVYPTGSEVKLIQPEADKLFAEPRVRIKKLSILERLVG